MDVTHWATALDTYIDIPFNLSLCLLLTLTSLLAIRTPRLLLSIVMATSAAILTLDKTSTPGEMIKTTCLLPLGLGSVLLFLSLSRPSQTKYLPMFTTYVNFAVYGNIAIMAFTPPGDTLRGLCTKITCAALFLWIVQQGRQHKWQTIMLPIHENTNAFLFRSVSRGWILAHAIYRVVLLTLPCFGAGRRHRLLEVYSLGLTALLARVLGVPFEWCFGMADTIVVPVAAGWSSVATTWELIPTDGKGRAYVSEGGDVLLSGVVLAVAAFACFNVARGAKDTKARTVDKTKG